MTMNKNYNFNAGPACLPEDVLQQIKNDIPDWQDGISIFEYGHRLPPIVKLRDSIESRCRSVLNVPDNFDVLLMHGGAQTLFGLIPLHFLGANESAQYCITGHWSKGACQEAKRLGAASVLIDSASTQFSAIPEQSTWDHNANAVYTYYCDNETIHGLRFAEPPVNTAGFLVADMTSSLGSRPIDYTHHGVIFASTQKNLGVAGLTLVLIDNQYIRESKQPVPRTLSFKEQASDRSMLNTPNVFAWYVLDLMLEWIESSGGVEYFAQKSQDISAKLYTEIDSNDFYANPVKNPYRSDINIPFTLPTDELSKLFLAGADLAGLKCLKGHRAVGGCRANIYNAMPEAGVDMLITFMQDFKAQHAT